LLAYLVANLDFVEPDDAGTYLGYKRVHDELGLQRKGPIWGNSLRMQGLEELADWTARMNLPAITGLVIDQTALQPGDGFFAAHGRPAGDHAWWRGQISRSRAFNWTAYVQPAALMSPAAVDLHYPERSLVETYRIIRDTVLSRRVKELHEYRCQLCGQTIELTDGRRYAEAHHLKPVGQPHNGPDVLSNLICVCPNDHAKLDYGVVRLDADEIRKARGHLIGLEYIEYHNASILQLST
jgi:hypothetical protein